MAHTTISLAPAQSRGLVRVVSWRRLDWTVLFETAEAPIAVDGRPA